MVTYSVPIIFRALKFLYNLVPLKYDMYFGPILNEFLKIYLLINPYSKGSSVGTNKPYSKVYSLNIEIIYIKFKQT